MHKLFKALLLVTFVITNNAMAMNEPSIDEKIHQAKFSQCLYLARLIDEGFAPHAAASLLAVDESNFHELLEGLKEQYDTGYHTPEEIDYHNTLAARVFNNLKEPVSIFFEDICTVVQPLLLTAQNKTHYSNYSASWCNCHRTMWNARFKVNTAHFLLMSGFLDYIKTIPFEVFKENLFTTSGKQLSARQVANFVHIAESKTLFAWCVANDIAAQVLQDDEAEAFRSGSC